MGRKSASGSGIRDEQPGSYFLELRNHFFWVRILKFFDADPGSGMETVRIRDPGWKKVGTLLVYEPSCGGGGCCGVSANEYSCARGAKINFGDFTLCLTYGGNSIVVALHFVECGSAILPRTRAYSDEIL